MKHAYPHFAFMQSLIIPLIKNKTGDLSDVNNCRAIALATSMSKIFEYILLQFVVFQDTIDANQFGFKSGHSTAVCTNVLKSVVGYCTSRASHVFSCFVDYNKAFDRVNFWKLFNELLNGRVNTYVVKILAFWYSKQLIAVKWYDIISQFFNVSNGTRQGSVLLPYFFARHIRNMLRSVNTRIGCNVGGQFLNILAYADDIVLLAPAWVALQMLIDVLQQEATKNDMLVNVKKTVCMVFNPSHKPKIVSREFKNFVLDGRKLEHVVMFKYLGHLISSDLSDDADVKC